MNINIIIITRLRILTISITRLIINFRNLVIILLTFELILLTIILLFATTSICTYCNLNTIFIVLIFSVAASETAIRLIILTTHYRIRGRIAIKTLNLLRG
uniref:NADH-ubiquinone oxidoreductase chain 4L n=1 Tax=Lophophysema eversa TaxID=1510205 RepID=A0A068LD29_9METZ|nr:NADH dehydrogenase subunit 4L [Lophophysema eversa]